MDRAIAICHTRYPLAMSEVSCSPASPLIGVLSLQIQEVAAPGGFLERPVGRGIHVPACTHGGCGWVRWVFGLGNSRFSSPYMNLFGPPEVLHAVSKTA